MVDKLHWLWVIAGGSLCFAFGMAYAFRMPEMCFVVGIGLTLALAGAAQYTAELVRVAIQSKSISQSEPIPPLV